MSPPTDSEDPLLVVWASLAGVDVDSIPKYTDPLLFCALAWAGVSVTPPYKDPIVHCLELVAGATVDTHYRDTVYLLLQYIQDHPVTRPYWFTQDNDNLYLNYDSNQPNFVIQSGNLIYNGNDNLTRQGDYVMLNT
jgi:hypothetical protein